MTSGVRRSRSLPFSARAGVAKTRMISAMQTLRTHSNESRTCIGMAPRQTVQSSKARNSDRTRKSGKVARHGSRATVKFCAFFEVYAHLWKLAAQVIVVVCHFTGAGICLLGRSRCAKMETPDQTDKGGSAVAKSMVF